MAEHLDDGEFWLPSQFLTDADILTEFTDLDVGRKQRDDYFNSFERYGLNFMFGFSTTIGSTSPNSDLSSPVESVNGSSETESDEDYDSILSGLTREVASLSFSNKNNNNKTPTLSSSPQSTLCSVEGGRGVEYGFGYDQNSSSGGRSPTGTLSPPLTMPTKTNNPKDASFDLLCAAAGEVAKMRKPRAEVGTGFFDSSMREILLSTGSIASKKPSSVSPAAPVSKPNNGAVNFPDYYHSLPPSQPQYQATQIQPLLRSQRMMKQQRQNMWGQQQQLKSNGGQQFPQLGQNNRDFVNGGKNYKNLSPSLWPPPQPLNQQNHQLHAQPQPLRPVFYGAAGPKRECAGTGVFLPRRISTNTHPLESRKKAGTDGAYKHRIAVSNRTRMQKKKNKTQGVAVSLVGGDCGCVVVDASTDIAIQLPQEWTY